VFREAGTQVSPVTMSCPSPWLHPVCCYKRPLEKGVLLLLAFGSLLWAFWCGKLLEGKRITEEKILKGKYQRGIDRKSALITLT
jgi:hypothetical protein